MENHWIPIRQQQPPTGQSVLVFEDAASDYNAPMHDTMRVAIYQGEGRNLEYVDARGQRHTACRLAEYGRSGWRGLVPALASGRMRQCVPGR
jgi:hypothetical protein